MFDNETGKLFEEVFDRRLCLNLVDKLKALAIDKRLVEYTEIIGQLLTGLVSVVFDSSEYDLDSLVGSMISEAGGFLMMTVLHPINEVIST